MDQWNGLLQALGPRFGPYVPRFLGAGALLLVAWLLAWLVRNAVTRAGQAAAIETRLRTPGLVALLANIAYWLVWLLALPSLLGALELEAFLVPVNAMMSRLLGILPNLLGAAVVLGIGLLAARILREVVTGVLVAAGSERIAARIGLSTALGDRTLAGIVGTAVFVLVLLPTLTAALQTTGLDIIAKPIGHLLDTIVDLTPKLIAAAVIVAVGAVLGRLLAGLAAGLAAGLGVNRLPAQLGMGEGALVGGRSLSELVGSVVMLAAVLLSITQASEVVGFAVLTEAIAMLGSVLARLVVAGVMVGAGLWAATLAAGAIKRSSVANAKALGHVARALVLFFASALALRQAGLPADIVTIAFSSVFGGAALAVAIAVGVGGRHVAARALDKAAASFGWPEVDVDVVAD